MKNKDYFNLLLNLLFILITYSTVIADDIGYSTVGSTSNTIGNNTSTNIYGSKYTSINGGTLLTAYINGHDNWNGTDTVVVLLYDDTSGYPHALIAESNEIIINSSSSQWWSASISGTIEAAAAYWLFVRNKTITSATVRIHIDANTISGYRTSDPSPTNDPFANGATINNNSEYSIYITYTASGGSLISHRRRIVSIERK